MSDPFVGEIRIFAGNFPPTGWAFCDGQLMAISHNTALFSLLGTTYGGDGRATFALPDLRGRAAMQAGSGPGLSPRELGESGGVTSVTLAATQLPAHSHQVNAALNTDQAAPDGSHLLGNAAMYAPAGTPVPMAAEAVGPSGGNAAHNNLQPCLTVSYIIALQGEYPPRS